MSATKQPTATWTILALIEWGTKYLSERGFEDARLNVQLLLSHVLHLPRIHLYTNFDRPLSAAELSDFKKAFQRRLAHEPLQYIIGESEFMGIPLFVNSSVLIPRPETEELVLKVVDWLRLRATGRVEVLDIGTGSGNIPIALERFAPNAFVDSIDISVEALAVASRNIERHQCSRIALHQQDVFGEVLPGRRFDAIVANPPYISRDEFVILQPEVRDFEPSIATTDNADGFRVIRRVCELAAEKLCDGGMLFMEVAYNQGNAVRCIAAGAGLVDVEVFTDHSGHERMVQGRWAA